MGTGLPVDFFDAREPEIGFVDQSRGLEGMIGSFATKIGRGETAEFGVDQGDEAFFGLAVSPLQFSKERRHIAG